MRKMTLEARLAIVCVQNLYVIGTFSLIWVYKLVIPYLVVRKFKGNGWSWFKTLGMVNVYGPTCHLEYMLLVVTEKRSSTCKSSGKLFSHSFPFCFQFWTIFCLTPYYIMHTVLGWKKQWPKQSVAFGTAVLFWSSMGLYGYLSQFYVLDR